MNSLFSSLRSANNRQNRSRCQTTDHFDGGDKRQTSERSVGKAAEKSSYQRDREVDKLNHLLAEERQASRRSIARLQRDLAKLKNERAHSHRDNGSQEAVMKELDQERILRLETEQRLNEMRMDSNTCRTRLGALQDELKKMEEMVRDMLQYKNKIDQLRQEKASLTSTFENNLQKCRNHMSTLERENMMLLNQVKKMESQLHSKGDDCDKSRLLLERLKILEAENSGLVLENEQQRQQYEKCLDQIANQVVQALLAQKTLREECMKLQTRVQDLEHQNQQLNLMFQHRIRFPSDSALQLLDDSLGRPRMSSPPPWLRDRLQLPLDDSTSLSSTSSSGSPASPQLGKMIITTSSPSGFIITSSSILSSHDHVLNSADSLGSLPTVSVLPATGGLKTKIETEFPATNSSPKVKRVISHRPFTHAFSPPTSSIKSEKNVNSDIKVLYKLNQQKMKQTASVVVKDSVSNEAVNEISVSNDTLVHVPIPTEVPVLLAFNKSVESKLKCVVAAKTADVQSKQVTDNAEMPASPVSKVKLRTADSQQPLRQPALRNSLPVASQYYYDYSDEDSDSRPISRALSHASSISLNELLDTSMEDEVDLDDEFFSDWSSVCLSPQLRQISETQKSVTGHSLLNRSSEQLTTASDQAVRESAGGDTQLIGSSCNLACNAQETVGNTGFQLPKEQVTTGCHQISRKYAQIIVQSNRKNAVPDGRLEERSKCQQGRLAIATDNQSTTLKNDVEPITHPVNKISEMLVSSEDQTVKSVCVVNSVKSATKVQLPSAQSGILLNSLGTENENSKPTTLTSISKTTQDEGDSFGPTSITSESQQMKTSVVTTVDPNGQSLARDSPLCGKLRTPTHCDLSSSLVSREAYGCMPKQVASQMIRPCRPDQLILAPPDKHFSFHGFTSSSSSSSEDKSGLSNVQLSSDSKAYQNEACSEKCLNQTVSSQEVVHTKKTPPPRPQKTCAYKMDNPDSLSQCSKTKQGSGGDHTTEINMTVGFLQYQHPHLDRIANNSVHDFVSCFVKDQKCAIAIDNNTPAVPPRSKDSSCENLHVEPSGSKDDGYSTMSSDIHPAMMEMYAFPEGCAVKSVTLEVDKKRLVGEECLSLKTQEKSFETSDPDSAMETSTHSCTSSQSLSSQVSSSSGENILSPVAKVTRISGYFKEEEEAVKNCDWTAGISPLSQTKHLIASPDWPADFSFSRNFSAAPSMVISLSESSNLSVLSAEDNSSAVSVDSSDTFQLDTHAQTDTFPLDTVSYFQTRHLPAAVNSAQSANNKTLAANCLPDSQMDLSKCISVGSQADSDENHVLWDPFFPTGSIAHDSNKIDSCTEKAVLWPEGKTNFALSERYDELHISEDKLLDDIPEENDDDDFQHQSNASCSADQLFVGFYFTKSKSESNLHQKSPPRSLYRELMSGNWDSSQVLEHSASVSEVDFRAQNLCEAERTSLRRMTHPIFLDEDIIDQQVAVMLAKLTIGDADKSCDDEEASHLHSPVLEQKQFHQEFYSLCLVDSNPSLDSSLSSMDFSDFSKGHYHRARLYQPDSKADHFTSRIPHPSSIDSKEFDEISRQIADLTSTVDELHYSLNDSLNSLHGRSAAPLKVNHPDNHKSGLLVGQDAFCKEASKQDCVDGYHWVEDEFLLTSYDGELIVGSTALLEEEAFSDSQSFHHPTLDTISDQNVAGASGNCFSPTNFEHVTLSQERGPIKAKIGSEEMELSDMVQYRYNSHGHLDHWSVSGNHLHPYAAYDKKQQTQANSDQQLADKEWRANLLDSMLPSGESNDSLSSDIGLDHMMSQRLIGRHKGKMEAIRFCSPRNRPAIDFSKFFIRFGQQEQEAVAAFDFLEQISTTSLPQDSASMKSKSHSPKREEQDVQNTLRSEVRRGLSEKDYAKFRISEGQAQKKSQVQSNVHHMGLASYCPSTDQRAGHKGLASYCPSTDQQAGHKGLASYSPSIGQHRLPHSHQTEVVNEGGSPSFRRQKLRRRRRKVKPEESSSRLNITSISKKWKAVSQKLDRGWKDRKKGEQQKWHDIQVTNPASIMSSSSSSCESDSSSD